MYGITIHVLGSGDAMDNTNHIYRARLMRVLTYGNADNAIIYGRKQAGLEASEAELGLRWLKPALTGEHPAIQLDEWPKSTSQTMQSVAERLHESLLKAHFHTTSTPSHHVVTNWPYAPRARYLLKKQWVRLYPDVPWRMAKQVVRFIPVGGTFGASLYRRGPRAVPWWLWAVAVREILAWGKALADPFDRRLNQNRESSKVFKP